jgi:hypothetical protein
MNKIYIITVIFAATLFTACEGFLDVKPEDGLVKEDFWKTESQVKQAVLGCYSSMMENDQFVIKLFQWGELRSDMLVATQGANVALKEQLEGLYLPGYSISDWALIYKTINQCNIVLEFAKVAQQNDKAFTIESLHQYEAEALALRALMYFYLARTFGDVPLSLVANYSDDQDFFIEKSTQADVLKQVEADLDTAAIYATWTYGNTASDKGRITKYTVFAMKADLSLWNDDYYTAIQYCDSIINSGKFGLLQGDDWYKKVFYDGNSNESLFELQYSQNKLNTALYNYFAPGASQQMVAAPVVYAYYFMPDESNITASDLRGDGAAFNVNNMAVWKYIGGPSKGVQRDVSMAYAHWIFYRLADIHLLKAEAEAQLGNTLNALDIAGNLHERGGNMTTTKFAGDSASINDVTKFILDERARELAFEGKRWFDILRVGKRNNYELKSYLVNLVTANVSATKISTVKNRYNDIRSHYLPIYTNELLRNYKLKQNPFYDTN